MAVEEFRIVAAKVRQQTEYIYLHVMGEPLLHPHLEEILDVATELGFKINITTNGTLISKKAELLRKYKSIRKVSVSLHSFEGNHPVGILTMPGEAQAGSKAFSETAESQKTGNEAFTEYLEDVWNFAAQADCIVALRLWNEGGANARNDEVIDFLSRKSGLNVRDIPDTANGRRLIDATGQLSGAKSDGNAYYNSRIYLESAAKFTWPAEQQDEQRVTFCHGLTQQVAVLCDGTVVPCCLDGEGTIALGNLLREELQDILASERAQRFIQGFVEHCPSEELCRHCDFAARFT